MSETTARLQVGGHSLADVVRPLVELQTYKNLLYLLLSLPLGVLYWTALLFGFVFGSILSIVGVGIAILAVTVVGSRYLAGFERWLAAALLTVDLPEPDDLPPSTGIWSTLKGYVGASSTWRGVGFLLLKVWLGFFGFLLVAFLWNAVELVSAPLRYPYAVEFGRLNGEPIAWTITTPADAAIAVPAGVVFGLLLVHAANGFARVSERIATSLLAAPDDAG